MELKTLDDVLEAELKDLYSAEKQLVKALPEIAKAATSKDLKEAVTEHLDETRGHVKRLEDVFEALICEPHLQSLKVSQKSHGVVWDMLNAHS